MDNFYSSIKVFDALKEVDVYCCGTLRENRGGPKGIKTILKKYKKSQGIILNN
jgi:hypothetical protein